MKYSKQYKTEIVAFIILSVAYFILRLVQILNVPMFTDEAIYTRWTQIALQDNAERFISLTDGKQPLFVWINMLFMTVVHDPLLSGRLVSVFAGFATMIGLFFLSKELFKKSWIGIFAMALYVIYPFALVYDRLAIYDSLVGTFYIWSLYLGVLLVKKMRLRDAIVLGVIMGGAALNKIGIFSIYLIPFNALLLNIKEKNIIKKIIRLCIYFVIAVVIEEAMYAILRISPWYYIIKQKNATFFYPFSDLLHKPIPFWWGNFLGNFHGLLSWFFPYMTWPVVCLICFAFIFYKDFWREKVLLFVYFFIPFTGLAILAKVIYPRYIFFMTLALLPIVAYALYKIYERIKNIFLYILLVIIFTSLMVYADFGILTDFDKAPIPEADLNQLVNDWPAGGGLRESVSFFQEAASHKKIYIGTEGTFGLLPFGLEAYMKNDSNVEIHGFWPISTTPPAEVLAASRKMPTYFIFYQPCPDCTFSGNAPVSWPGHLVKRYTKGIGKTYYSIYQINP